MNDLRRLPSVDRLLQTPQAENWIRQYGRTLTLSAIRAALEQIRQGANLPASSASEEPLFRLVEDHLTRWTQLTLQPVINATGVILHTNLGRAPLSPSALQSIQTCASGYSTLEFDVTTGKRGKREIHAQQILTRLIGAEDALVVNNNAAAVLLALSALARRKPVIISRTQLVEIGGGFRVPEVMKQSGAKLIEIGTTNRVHLSDYENALQNHPGALILHAHHSNFRLIGFASEPELTDITALARQYQTIVIDDLGSGALLDTAPFGLEHEPTVQESLQAGCDLVCFSGDKLLGGPQAGILVGKADLLSKIKKHPLARAVRADKLCLAALAATLLHYLKDEALTEIPVWQMIAVSREEIRQRALNWQNRLGFGEVISGLSTVGGGSLPEETLPTWLLALSVPKADGFLARLREGSPAIIARIENDRVVFDPRTVFPQQDEELLTKLQGLLASHT
ncbi:L-seryl-tRNA(Sec) selenium transferase [Bellilinea caldifistulae]|uniref:L-seryl-tRNA(Sec) selenium transferase n=1 Tax=Bellilinea caldifistulae TaxID=360411 RepID=A0A0P6X2J9_9CHLR|nr:L-seryl-tRNA(Sec) selenium transferase [Bellilinea caldifistulae]KPL73616.1 selenocysteine synthase [Bellilinea caldifistulae]GAP10245.1 L-seryl-tRNA(Sec) selenium transferase [Bellilinea caldifistulae]